MTIYLAGNRVTNFTYGGHLQLVRDGQETEIQAPKPIPIGSWQFWPTFSRPHDVAPHTIGDPETYSSAPVELADDIDEGGAWMIFEQVWEQLIPLNLPYDLLGFNSNSYINTLLNAIGHTATEFVTYPTSVSLYPGIERDVADGFWGLDYTLEGGANSDAILGGRGDDTLSGGEEVDFIEGGKGTDIIYSNTVDTPADDSADYLKGGGGRDTFHVGNTDEDSGLFVYDSVEGVTTFNVASRGSYDVILDHSQFDEIYVTWGDGSFIGDMPFSDFEITPAGYDIDGKDVYFAATDDLQLSAIYDTYYNSDLERGITVMVFWYQILARRASVDGQQWEVNTPLFAIEVSPGSVGFRAMSSIISGTEDDDTLIGSGSADEIFGGAGDDTISGGDGNDLLLGEAGDDDFFGHDADGVDHYDGGVGINSYTYEGAAALTINAPVGTISAVGEATDTYANMTAFFGSSGNDTLIDDGNIRLFDGGGGSDTFALSGDLSEYRIYAGGNGYNIERASIDRDMSLESRYLRLEGVENVTIDGISVSLQGNLVNPIIGTSSGEAISGTTGADEITAGDGDDIVQGSAGSDLIDGGEGANRVDYVGVRGDYTFKANAEGTVSASHNTLGYDVLVNIQSVLFVGEGVEYQMTELLASVPTDATVVGTSGADMLYGTAGADVLFGDAGDDYLEGGAGSDVYSFRTGDGNDKIDDWDDPTSTDVVRFDAGIAAEQVAITRGASDAWDAVLTTANGDSITIKGGFYPLSTVVEEVHFSDNTVWTAQDVRALHLAQSSTSGDDTINGFLESNDVISGGEGNDTVYGFSGNDQIFGDAGADALFGDEGNDVIAGGAGDDFLVGGLGSDTFVFSAATGEDWVDDFNVADDIVDLSAFGQFNNLSDVLASSNEWIAGTTWIELDAGNFVRLQGVSMADLQTDNFIFQ